MPGLALRVDRAPQLARVRLRRTVVGVARGVAGRVGAREEQAGLRIDSWPGAPSALLCPLFEQVHRDGELDPPRIEAQRVKAGALHWSRSMRLNSNLVSSLLRTSSSVACSCGFHEKAVKHKLKFTSRR